MMYGGIGCRAVSHEADVKSAAVSTEGSDQGLATPIGTAVATAAAQVAYAASRHNYVGDSQQSALRPSPGAETASDCLPCSTSQLQGSSALTEVCATRARLQEDNPAAHTAATFSDQTECNDVEPRAQPNCSGDALATAECAAEANGSSTSLSAADAADKGATAQVGDQHTGSTVDASNGGVLQQSAVLAAIPTTPAAVQGTPAERAVPAAAAGSKQGIRAKEQQGRALAAGSPAQTAAEMLSWLDATLAAKKPVTSKIAALTPAHAPQV